MKHEHSVKSDYIFKGYVRLISGFRARENIACFRGNKVNFFKLNSTKIGTDWQEWKSIFLTWPSRASQRFNDIFKNEIPNSFEFQGAKYCNLKKINFL